ncbi:protein cordon-bleu isoform X2 [Rhinichthys klamathensis goyatoka]|uniref:protein cordon-bleu isoform X2 n=1 Tax=Rhinichthys klamathensis goyatoka TaxID=3034132 RepID=UPI0024B5CC7E|nr:protein cordon-bleu isoform X2 [Rhinichthys klamathensis goyatoka]
MNLGDATIRPVERRMKAKAPPPPRPPQPAPRRIFRNAVPDGGGSSGGDSKENMLQPSVDLHISLPSGYQTTVNVDGRKALMDLLVDLCSQYHLNPAYHTLELLSSDAQHINFKPNTLLGALDVSCALIKERVLEDKVIRKPPPKVPEKTVRLVVNYHHSQKAVVRVNPLVPLHTLVPVICQKCEFDPAHVLLFRDNVSHQQLDLDKSLSELGIRELYVLDQMLVLQPKMASTPALNYSAESLHSSSLSGSDKKGLLGFLKFNRRKSKTEDQSSEDMDSLDDDCVVDNADTNINGMSGPCVETRPSTLGQSQSVMNISKMSPKVELKKRRAPAPPSASTQTLPLASQINLGSPSSYNQLKKRKAPAPPPTPPPSTPEPVISTSVPTAPVRAPCNPLPVEKTLLPSPRASTPADDSDLSHSIEDSEPARSICSSSSGDDAAAGSSSSSLAEEPITHQAHVIAAYTTSSLEPEPEPEHKEEAAPLTMPEQKPGPSSEDPTPEDPVLEMELKMEEMENNRNSGIAWQHSAHESLSERVAEQEVETVSVASSESFADQGYAASEGMAEESGLVSPSERVQSISPVDIMSLNSASALPAKSKDSSSDSDEGCATWGSRKSGNIQRGQQSIKRQNGYEEDPEITAQIHLTLANLDANLADINHSGGASVFVDDEIPVSIVDMDIPVTTIDDVLDDDRFSMSEYEAELLSTTQNITSQSCTPCEAIQNKNNNACLTEEKHRNPSPDIEKQSEVTTLTVIEKTTSPSLSNEKLSQDAKHIDNMEQKAAFSSETKSKAETEELKSQKNIVSQKPQSFVRPAVQTVQKVTDERLKSAPMVQKFRTEPSYEDRAPITRVLTTQGKITQSSFSRFGMKTFTVIPPKPSVSQTKPTGSLVLGAIKIDEQGNMVTGKQISTGPPKNGNLDVDTCAEKSPLDKAKAFWSTAEKQDQSTATNQGTIDVFKPLIVSGVSKLSLKTPPEETHKEVIILERKSISVVGSKPTSPEPPKNHSFTAERRDLSFLIPSRRTSSQYVASAIAKNNSIPNTKVVIMQAPSESIVGVKKPVNHLFNNEVRPTNIHKPTTTFKPTENTVPSFGHPKCLQSYPSHVAEKPASSERICGIEKGTLHGEDSLKSLDSHPLNNKILPSTHVSGHIKHMESSSEEATSINKFPDTSSARKTPELYKSEIPSEPDMGNIFGPVKKFKPVIFKSVQKETSIHSSLMESIQSGEGIERLKKVSDMSTSCTVKKPSYNDAENERSALFSAIRASSNSAGLKKIKSGAAKELEQLRKIEEDRNVQRDVISPPPTSPLAFVPPPPPAFSPPPPPPSAPAKPPLVLPAGGNPEAAREALLDAIRSGSGAQRLRKVPVTQTRRQVNGRLGTIQATSLSYGH